MNFDIVPGVRETSTADAALEAVSRIYTEFGRFVQMHGEVSEADTRAKVIERIIREALAWPEPAIRREEPIVHGFLDYTLTQAGRPALVVEAKRAGKTFEVPANYGRTHRYKLNGAIRSERELYRAIEQAQTYCVERAVTDAVVTNGYAWIVYRALRKDLPWREGYALVFPSARYILDNFTQFWNLLSYDAIAVGSLDRALASGLGVPKAQFRVLSYYRPADADAPLARNSLHTPLHAFVETVFRDIAEPDQEEQLRLCYVRDQSVETIDHDLKTVIRDSMPQFAREDGALPLVPGPNDAGFLGVEVSRAARLDDGSVFLVLGGIGSGKTTLLKRFFNFVGKDSLEGRAIWFYLDLRAAPVDPLDIEDFVAQQILDQLRTRYGNLGLETRENLKQAYAAEIGALDTAILGAESLSGADYERRLSRYLEKWRDNVFDYARHLLVYARSSTGVVLCIDNVDQWPADYQAVVFLMAQRIAQQMKAVTIVALREESYYVARIQKVWTAYNNRKFHISSPSFRTLIELRMQYLNWVLRLPLEERKAKLRTRDPGDDVAIGRFFRIISNSIFKENRNIVRFIEALAYGNMRDALDMFSMFLYSGAIDVDKMLAIYSREGGYTVPFHEFAKAIMLGERAHYRESSSRIINIFDRGPEGLSSHFTAMRLLKALLENTQTSSPEGRGFVPVADVIRMFADVFGDEQDVIYQANRLLRARLLQVDTRSDSIDGARFLRATSGGWYYARYLCNKFAYLDLVSEDTALDNRGVVESLWDLSQEINRIRGSYVDSEDERVHKLDLRFRRVDTLIRHFEKMEGDERAAFGLKSRVGIVAEPVMTSVATTYRAEQAFIKERFAPDSWDDEPEIVEAAEATELQLLLNLER